MPGKDVWLWTGYRLDELSPAQRELLGLIHVLVDGKFVQEQADPSLKFRGSANQVIHLLNALSKYKSENWLTQLLFPAKNPVTWA